jgi:hypothetical protein
MIEIFNSASIAVDLDEAVDAAHFLIAQARLLNKRDRESADSRRR